MIQTRTPSRHSTSAAPRHARDPMARPGYMNPRTEARTNEEMIKYPFVYKRELSGFWTVIDGRNNSVVLSMLVDQDTAAQRTHGLNRENAIKLGFKINKEH